MEMHACKGRYFVQKCGLSKNQKRKSYLANSILKIRGFSVHACSRDYDTTKDEAFNEALNALKVLGFEIKKTDKTEGLIEAKKGASIWTWGENIKISVISLKKGCSVYVESRVKYQIVDYGKNRENVVKILTELNRRIKR